jgi:hypothetical protein
VEDDCRTACAPPFPDHSREVRGPPQPVCAGQHDDEASGGEPSATLAPAGGKDPAPGAGTHTKAEAVRLGAPTVVGLERALAHGTDSQGLKALTDNGRAEADGTIPPRTHSHRSTNRPGHWPAQRLWTCGESRRHVDYATVRGGAHQGQTGRHGARTSAKPASIRNRTECFGATRRGMRASVWKVRNLLWTTP